MTQADACPICAEPIDGHEAGYVLEGRQVVTCYMCWGTIMQLMLEVKLGQRADFLGRSFKKLQARLHEALLKARGRSDLKTHDSRIR